jgi:hypothetical protein
MEDMTIKEYLDTFSVSDKMIAFGAIANNTDWLSRNPETLSADELKAMEDTLARHVITNGRHGVKMAVLVGRAITSSIKYPIKKKTGLIQRFKDKIKEWLS